MEKDHLDIAFDKVMEDDLLKDTIASLELGEMEETLLLAMLKNTYLKGRNDEAYKLFKKLQ